MAVRTRFAPSPTGFLHVGSARTALYAWLYARQQGGQFIVRIEDTDKEREVEGAIGHMMESLSWLGIRWDESIDVGGQYGPYIQSARLSLYKEFALELVARGHAYPDPYTEADVENFRLAAQEAGKPFLYRNHRPEISAEWDGTTPLRFRTPTIKRTDWHDIIMGDLTAGEEALDDFILIKSDGFPTYNFAHVIDDITMRITHVMRGQEFISSTPKFLSLYEALGETPPAFATLPPILGDSGTKKLSKRDGAKDILDYRREGFLPEAMVNFLALLGWHPSEGDEVITKHDLLNTFDLSRVQRAGAQFDDQKLLFINREWMRKLSDDMYAKQLQAYIQTSGADSEPREISLLLRLIPLLKERAHTFSEAAIMLTTELAFVKKAPVLDAAILASKTPAEGEESGAQRGASHLYALRDLIRELPTPIATEAVTMRLMPYADAIPKEQGGRGAALWPLRYALSGQERSPDPFTLISILQPQEVQVRIDAAIAILQA